MRQLIIIIFAGVLGLMPVFAGSIQIAGAQQENDVALVAVRDDNVIPYGSIRETIESRYGGRIVGLQLIQAESGLWIYELKILRETGRVLSLLVDATTGQVMDTRGD